MTGKQEKVQVYGNNCVRKTAGVKKIDKGRTEELGEKAGVKDSLTRKLVKSQLKWAGHVVRMEGNGPQRERMQSEWVVEGEEEDRD